jgi:adenine-specific DNA methylase
VPDEPVNPVRPSPNARGLSAVTRYGIQTFGDLFTARQKLVLARFAKTASVIPASMAKEAVALAVSRLANSSTALCRWHQSGEKLEGIYSRQAIAFVWDFCEGNPLSDSTGGFTGALDWIAAVAEAGNQTSVGQVQRADACKSPLANCTSDVWFTDPPYYDSIPYADLSDFFFIWLKRVLPRHPILNSGLDPQTGLTPKTEECVWNQSHLVNGQPKDGEFFERTISRAFTESRRVLKHDGVGCVVFAHKTTEGWEALFQGF